MSWNHIIEQHQATFQRDFVACHEPAEREWIIEQVQWAFPQWRKSVVQHAITEVCTHMRQTPRPREAFFRQLQVTLENPARALPTVGGRLFKKSKSNSL